MDLPAWRAGRMNSLTVVGELVGGMAQDSMPGPSLGAIPVLVGGIEAGDSAPLMCRIRRCVSPRSSRRSIRGRFLSE